MKHISIIMILITVAFYGSISGQTDNDNSKESKNNFQDSLSQKIIGIWGIYSFETKNIDDSLVTITICNVCPKINFKGDMIAILTLPSQDADTLDWKVNDDNLTITNRSNNRKSNTLSADDYKIDLYRKDGYQELRLSVEKEKYLCTTVLRQ